jgi:hypothetical protein
VPRADLAISRTASSIAADASGTRTMTASPMLLICALEARLAASPFADDLAA